MSWIAYALIGHVANGAAFVIDKALLSTAFKRSATYAGLVGILSLFTLVAIPWVETWPQGTMALTAVVSGATFIFALHAFFAALARSEASRVVPIVGALIPIATLAGTAIFLGERLTPPQLLGFMLLIAATAVLSSSGGKAKPTREAILLAIISAVLFAVSSVTGKTIYDNVGFLSGFISTRIAAGITACLLVIVFDRTAGKELLSVFGFKKQGIARAPRHAAWLAVLGQSLGAVGFLFVQLAIAGGSAAIVNALQAVQYAFLVLVGFVLQRIAPRLLGELVTKSILMAKISALALVALGLTLVL